MLTLDQVEFKYEELLLKWANEYGAEGDPETMKMHFGKVGWIAALGWVLGKTPFTVGEDMESYVKWVHRENPSVVERWTKPS